MHATNPKGLQHSQLGMRHRYKFALHCLGRMACHRTCLSPPCCECATAIRHRNYACKHPMWTTTTARSGSGSSGRCTCCFLSKLGKQPRRKR